GTGVHVQVSRPSPLRCHWQASGCRREAWRDTPHDDERTFASAPQLAKAASRVLSIMVMAASPCSAVFAEDALCRAGALPTVSAPSPWDQRPGAFVRVVEP